MLPFLLSPFLLPLICGSGVCSRLGLLHQEVLPLHPRNKKCVIHLSMSTVSATSFGFHVSGAASLSTPDAGPTVIVAVTNWRRSMSSLTIRCRASEESGGDELYFSGGRASTILSGLALSVAVG